MKTLQNFRIGKTQSNVEEYMKTHFENVKYKFLTNYPNKSYDIMWTNRCEFLVDENNIVTDATWDHF